MAVVMNQAMDPYAANLFSADNNLHSPWLGPLSTQSAINEYETRHHDMWNMDEAYKGRNDFLGRTVMEQMYFQSSNAVLASRILPLRESTDLHLAWEHVVANPHFMPHTPYQSVSPLVTQQRHVRKASLVRRGLGFQFEHDFVKTALGRTMFYVALGQIANSAMETIQADIVRELVYSHRFRHQLLKQTNRFKAKNLKQYFRQERERMFIVQKQKNGLEKLDMEVSKEMGEWRGRADAWLIPEEISIYTTIVPAHRTDQYIAGERGPARVNGDPAGRFLASGGTTKDLDRIEPEHFIRNADTYVLRSFQVDNVGKDDLLSGQTQTGGYYKMLHSCQDPASYTTKERSIQVYDEDADQMVEISLQDAIASCNLWDKDGNLLPANQDGEYGVGASTWAFGNRDFQRDFLTNLSQYKQGNYAETFTFGQIAPEYLDVQTIMEVAKAVSAKFPENTYRAQLGAQTQPIYAALPKETKAAIEQMAHSINQLMGAPVPFTPEQANLSVGERFYQSFVLSNVAPVVRDDDAMDEDEEPVESKADGALRKMLEKSAPATKKAEIDAILASHGDDLLSAAAEVQEAIRSYIGEGVKGLPKQVRTEEALVQSFSGTLARYKELKEQERTTKVAARARPVGSSVAGYMRPGQNLAGTGFKYLHEASARPAQGGIHSVMPVRAALDAQASRASQARAGGSAFGRQTGSGYGLQGIGMMYYGEDDSAIQNIEAEQSAQAMNADNFQMLSAHIDAINNASASSAEKDIAKYFLAVPITRQRLLDLAANNVPVPINFLIMSPHNQYRTRTLIKCLQDGGSGYTYWMAPDSQIESEAGRKISQYHFTIHFRAIVTNPENVYVARNCYSEDYEGGNNTRFYTPELYARKNSQNLTHSLICAPLPVTETRFPNPLSISGRFYAEKMADMITDADFDELHYSTAARISALYKLREEIDGMGANVADVGSFFVGNVLWNHNCYQGRQDNFNPKSGRFELAEKNTGPWEYTAPGVAAVRRGEKQFLLDVMNDQTKRVY